MFVASGKKRIVVIPPSAHTYNCTSFHGTCFPGVDVLTEIPDFAQVVELTSGEGFNIPYMHWHAVENLEPTVGFSLQVEYEFDPSKAGHKFSWNLAELSSSFSFSSLLSKHGDVVMEVNSPFERVCVVNQSLSGMYKS